MDGIFVGSLAGWGGKPTGPAPRKVVNPADQEGRSGRRLSRRFLSCLAIAAAACAALPAAASAGKFNAVLSPGDAAPDAGDLVDAEGRRHTLSDYRQARAVVLVFTCQHCPVAGAYLPRLVAVQKDYEARGVRLVAINCDRREAADLAALGEFADRHEFNFPYLADASQATARRYGVRVTPEVIVLDQDRKVAYLGAVDDNWSAPDEVGKRYLRDALDAVLAGRRPEIAESRPRGCLVSYDE